MKYGCGEERRPKSKRPGSTRTHDGESHSRPVNDSSMSPTRVPKQSPYWAGNVGRGAKTTASRYLYRPPRKVVWRRTCAGLDRERSRSEERRVGKECRL